MAKVTNFAELAKTKGVQTIVLPGWEDGKDFVCLAKRPSVFNMASTGHIPNPLMGSVHKLFSGSVKDITSVSYKDQADVFLTLAKYALVEPTFDEITDAGMELTDDQLTALYAFAVGGVARLDSFRASIRPRTGTDGAAVQDKAVAPADD